MNLKRKKIHQKDKKRLIIASDIYNFYLFFWELNPHIFGNFLKIPYLFMIIFAEQQFND